jgi:predicted metal-dependent phosphoesterase TrpH
MRTRFENIILASMFVTGVIALGFTSSWPDAKRYSRRDVGTMLVDVRDETGSLIPARLTFRPIGDTPKLAFTTTDIGHEEVGAVAAFDRVFVLRGKAEVHVPTGAYEVWVSHGPEWDTTSERITVKASKDTELHAKLHHVIDTPGWISGDFHVHAAASFDSRVPLRDRVHQFVADGVDLIVSTDHNTIADYAPVIAELGVTDLLASATGDEITTKTWGHFGTFPLAVDDGELGRGAIATGKRTPAQIFADVRKSAPTALIDIHHPRLEQADFDAIEVLNGYQDPDHKTVHKVIDDWIAFLDSGKHVTATGNSDTHHLTFNLGGYPRNYVAIDVPVAKIDPAAVAAAVKAGHSYFTTGPIVDASISGHGLGEMAAAKSGRVELKLTVRAASWISTTTITIIGSGGATLASRTLPRSTDVVRFDDTIPLDIPKDGYVIVHVDGDQPMAPNVGDLSGFRVYPFALTNPIWVDADGDGKITPRSP